MGISRLSLLLILTAAVCAEPGLAQDNTGAGGTFDGKHKFLITGYGFTNLTNHEHEPANFSLGFNPILLWKPGKSFLFESEIEFSFSEGETNVELEYAQQLYVVNDYLVFGAGKFLSPINIFMERLHPAWINKLPDMPLGVSGHGGVPLLATTQLGIQVRGAVPLASARVAYALYVSNGPSLNTEEEESGADGHAHGASAVGTLNFNNTSDQNDGKAIGGRVGIIPIPGLELGYGIETAKVGAAGTIFEDVQSLNNVIDISYAKDIGFIKGRVDIRGQQVWLSIDNPDEHPLEFENDSSSGYLQFAYRPSGSGNRFVQSMEAVFRYDRLDLPAGAPLNTDQNRVSLGVNYWTTPSSVFKLAFASTRSEEESGDVTEYKIVAQGAMGF